MTPLELQRRLRDGRNVYGTLIVSPSPRWPDTVARIGLDFVFIDTEHIALDREALSWMCQTYARLGLPALVRIPKPDPYEACKVLDGGAAGIIAPYIEHPEQARELAGAVKYRPLKGRRLAGILSGSEAAEPALKAYLEEQNAGRLLILNIESLPGIEALDAILEVPGIDALLIGPHDLSCSLGRPEDYGHPQFEESARTIFAKARAAGVGAGIHSWMGIEREAAWARAGANLIIHEADILTFLNAQRADLARLKEMLGESAAGTGAIDPI